MSKEDDIAYCARALGVEAAEIVEVLPDPDGVVAQTRDGKRTLIRDNGELLAAGGIIKEPALAVERGPAGLVVPEDAKVTRTRRSRS